MKNVAAPSAFFVVSTFLAVSTSHPEEDICDTLAGDYPKDFLFDGWHPQCFCFVTPIMLPVEEMAKMNEAFARGEKYVPKAKPITEYPQGFKNWVSDNADKIAESRLRGTEPYFIRNNASVVDGILNPNAAPVPNAASKGNVDDFVKEKSLSKRQLYTDDYCKELCGKFKVGGNESPEEIKQFFLASPWGKMDVLKLDDDMRQIFTDFGANGIDLMSTTLTLRSRNSLRITWDGGPSGITLMRTFSIDRDGATKVHHDLFTLPKNYQGKGISKAVFRGLYEQYQAAGVKYMDVFANIDIGGYTWAKYGFCTTDKNEALSAINFNTLSKMQKDEIIGIIDEHFAKSNAPFPMSKIAMLSFGKEALLGQYWDGVLDLTDPTQRKYFENYIGFNSRGN